MGIYTGHNPSSQDDIEKMTDAELADHFGVPEAVPQTPIQKLQKAILETFNTLGNAIIELQTRIADLETVVDEIPNMGALFGAVQELQEQHEAPANTFTHYIGGSRV
jgi:enamine deaminase RidA (YjgF/YER057c/UK114 family)